MNTTTIYIYELSETEQQKIKESITAAVKGIIPSDRLENEVNILMTGRLDDLRFLEVKL